MTGNLRIKKGNYYAVIACKDAEGKRKQKWISAGIKAVKGNKRAAEAFLTEKIREFKESEVGIGSNMLFSDFMHEWLSVISVTVAKTTLVGYTKVVEGVIIPYFKPKKIFLSALKPIDIQKFYSKRLNDGVSANTIKHYHANIHKALNYAIRNNLISYNPAARVELPKKERFLGKFYTVSEIQKLLSVTEKTTIETPVMLAVYLGLRKSEVLGLKWGAIDFENRTISIQHTVKGAGKDFCAEDRTKNLASFRTLPMSSALYTYLKKVQDRQLEYRKIFNSNYIQSDYVCTWEDGKLLLPNYVSKKFKEILFENNLPIIRFHDLRHTCATLLLEQGFGLKDISEWLGHCDISTTANIYGHVQYKAKQRMGNVMSEVISRKNERTNERTNEKTPFIARLQMA